MTALATRDARIEIGDVAARLAACRVDWLQHYAPAGRIAGGEFLLGNAEGDPGHSLPVPLRPNGKPLVDFAVGPVGDDLDLLARLIGGTVADAYREAMTYLGLGGGNITTPQPRPTNTAGPPVSTAEDNRETAQEIWRQGHSLCGCKSCTPGRIYLQKHRLIERWPEALYFHAACPFGRERAPAILAPVNCHRTAHVVGVWRIRLTDNGEKVGRFGLGPMKGNSSRLFWADGDELTIAEGVEDALAVHALTGLPCWAALSAGNMARLVIPLRYTEVSLFADADDVGRQAAHVLAGRLREEDRQVRVLRALAGKDANDQLLARSGAA